MIHKDLNMVSIIDKIKQFSGKLKEMLPRQALVPPDDSFARQQWISTSRNSRE